MVDIPVDVLGEPWRAETLTLAPDEEGEVVATLVSRRAEIPTGKAVLFVHGFADYFFQTDFAEWWVNRGYDFYALDLRKYGRSMRPHQTATYVDDLHAYYEELDIAWQQVVERDGHDQVVLSAHSTGGLTISLWANARQPQQLSAMVLNSPWLDMQGSAWLRSLAATTALNQLAQRQPMRVIPRAVSGYYTRSLHRAHEGDWEFNLIWKPIESFPVRAGWLRAVRLAHAELQAGLDVKAPVLVLASATSAWPKEMGDAVFNNDIVLDAEQIRHWSTSIGRHVTYVGVPGALHDVVLSRPGPRAQVYAELNRWCDAYLEAAPSTSESASLQA